VHDCDFTTTVTTDRSPEEVTASVLDVRGWWDAELRGSSAAPGDEFHYLVPGIHRSHIRVDRVEPGRLVTWRVLENWFGFAADDWAGTEVRFEVRPRTGGGSELVFTHVGLRPDQPCYEACHDGWSYYVGTSLRDLVETGQGHPGRMPQQLAALAALGDTRA
jgi:hypothetical protein